MDNNQDRIEIGVVTVEYNKSGSFKSSTFKPTLQSTVSPKLFKEIDFKGKPISDEESIKEIADNSLSSFYADMSSIELADREEYEIVSEIQKQLCQKFPDGTIQSCTLKYYFQKRKLWPV